MNDVSVLLEHVHLLDGLDRLDVHLLQSRLKLLVVGAGGLVDFLDFAAGSAFASEGLLVTSNGLLGSVQLCRSRGEEDSAGRNWMR